MFRLFFIFFGFWIVLTQTLICDTIYWADKVLGYSSQVSNKEFSAAQLLGEPSVMPHFGSTSAAWMPKYPTDRIEWIKVKFPKKIYVRQILINENLNPGAIVKIILYDSLNQGKLVFSNHKISGKSSYGKLSKINLDSLGFRSDELKIEVNLVNYLEEYQIDAVGIADYKSDYTIKPNYIEDSTNIVKVRLDDNINSPYSELAPLISQDGTTLVFTRDRHPENTGSDKRQDVWMSKIETDGNFSKAVNLGEPINNDFSNFAISLSTNANEIYLGQVYHPNGLQNSGFSVSRFNGSFWSFPDSVVIEDYYNFNDKSSFYLSNTGKILITGVKRNDSYGKTDLYVSFLNEKGVWSAPINLGKSINTAEEELSPFLAADNKTLYFSTSGYPGFGNSDMFLSKRLDDTWTNWSEPQNLGPHINSAGWDAYYTITADGKYAYYVSSQGSSTAEDIYRVELPKIIKPEIVVIVKGKVLNQKTNEPLATDIKYEILPEGIEAGVARSNPVTGDYSIILPAGKLYGFLASTKGFASINENINLDSIKEFKEINRNLYLVPIEKGQTVRINNIFFSYNEHELLPESYSELNRLVKLLIENPSLKIKIGGHTDNIGNDNFNKNLSLKRAESVKNYLLEKNITSDRLSIIGYGRSRPIADNDTEEGRSKNRRVEFLITEN